jgi:hypothetical protein
MGSLHRPMSGGRTANQRELLRATTRIVRAGGLTDEQCAQLLPIILAATTHTDPEHNEEEDQSRPVTGWSESPRISAAEAAILLARYTSACTTELRTAIRHLSTDSVRVVRSTACANSIRAVFFARWLTLRPLSGCHAWPL